MSFRKDFIWGAATASYQIEGAAFEAGKGASVWDTFSHWDGKILHGDTGDIACDHYHRFRDDVKLMAQLGIKNYRFSLSWPRLLPDGTGRVNEEGVAFYNQLIDALLHERADQITRRGAGRMIERLDRCIDGLHRAATALQLRFPCREGAFFALQTEKSIRKFPIRIVPAADGKKRMDGKTERTCLLDAGKSVPGRECAAAMTYLFA